MRILAASLLDAADRFLHAGYISAYPRHLHTAWAPDRPQAVVDVTEALALSEGAQGVVVPQAAQGAQQLAPALAPGFMEAFDALLALGAAWLVVAGVVMVMGRAYGALLPRQRRTRWRARRARLTMTMLGGVLALLTLGGVSLARAGGQERAPVSFRPYAHPELATQVLLQGLLAEAWRNLADAESIGDLAPEVALPLASPHAGQAQALNAFHLDGWGRPIRMLHGEEGERTLVSSGPDGLPDTQDDLSASIRPRSDGYWDHSARTYYARLIDGEPAVFFLRWPGRLFKYRHREEARHQTGGGPFDVLLGEEIPERIAELLAQELRSPQQLLMLSCEG